MGNCTENRISAFLTVEASLLMPMMIMLLVITIYWTFYMYNNCVVYQDCYISSLRGSQMMDMEVSEVKSSVLEYAKDLLDNQLFQYQNIPNVDVNMFEVSVNAKSSIDNKVKNFLGKEKGLSVNREASSRRIDPVKLIRNIY